MNKLLLTAALSLSSLALAAPWNIDSAHASANFSVRHLMVSNVTGRLGDVKGTVDFDEKDVTKSKIEATIAVDGINTNMPDRDKHLKSPEFFDVEKFATITFKSTKVEKADKKLKVSGDLTIKGVTKPVVLEAEISDEVKNPFTQAPTRAVTASTTINREDFGLSWNKPMANNGVMVGKDVKISIELEMNKPAPAAPAAPAKK